MNHNRRGLSASLGLSGRTRIWLQVIAVCGFLAMAAAPSARADGFTYTYTGLDFTNFSPGSTCPPQCGISGFITLMDPVTTPLFAGDVEAFSFTDGELPISNLSASSAEIHLTAGPDGSIASFLIVVQADFLSPTCNGTLTVTLGATNEADDYSQGECFNITTLQTTTAWSDNVGMGGSWTGPTSGSGSAVPEPPGALLLGTALALLGIVVIARKRALPFRAFTLPRSAGSQNV